MNIRDTISELRLEKRQTDGFLVKNLPGNRSFFIGIDNNNCIVFLIKPKDNITQKQPNSSRGKFLDVLFDTECEISTPNGTTKRNYTILSLKSEDETMERVFISVCSDISELLGENPDYIKVIKVVNTMRDLFSKILQVSKKEETGLWGELFLIYISSDKELLIDSWHVNPRDTFDFNDGNTKLEVKTTTRNERIHTIKLNQILKSIESCSLICSIMTSRIDLGVSVIDLIDKISVNIKVEYRQKLINKVLDSAGENFKNFKNRYDLKTSKNSFKFYNANNIPSINTKHISNDISNIKFDVSLENIKDVNIKEKNKSGILSVLS